MVLLLPAAFSRTLSRDLFGKSYAYPGAVCATPDGQKNVEKPPVTKNNRQNYTHKRVRRLRKVSQERKKKLLFEYQYRRTTDKQEGSAHRDVVRVVRS